jgi:hypothetical protein
MNKKFILLSSIIVIIIVAVSIFLVVRNLNQPRNSLPYCESAPTDLHYNLAVEYLANNYPSYSVLKESATQTGPCNNGNTAWTKFDALENNLKIGELTVNGDTNQVTFQK